MFASGNPAVRPDYDERIARMRTGENIERSNISEEQKERPSS
ncbi:msl6021 [Mesorhizobium japonicum MAFF 303099]|uniref:Msl6021 protein n=1 Tax=Mesorhizobium japonicum (strain LMG 29417 / CECT 9101 / MAFF 303099) TaxID=266835 RepID=Q98AF6_RHILO|nr:msl6021 [Mesorhizobium japonicum MAFF 303099]